MVFSLIKVDLEVVLLLQCALGGAVESLTKGEGGQGDGTYLGKEADDITRC